MSDFSRLVELAIKEIKHDSDPDLVVIQSLLRKAQEHDAILTDLFSGDIRFERVNRGAFDKHDLTLEVLVSAETRQQIFQFLSN